MADEDRHNGEHGGVGGRKDMENRSCAQGVVALLAPRVRTTMVVAMGVSVAGTIAGGHGYPGHPMAMAMARQKRTCEVHHATGDGTPGGHGPRLQKLQDRLRGDGERHRTQQQDRRDTAEALNRAGAEGEAQVAGVSPGKGTGRGCNAPGANMGGHMETISQKRHGAGETARDDFTAHHRGGEPDDGPGSGGRWRRHHGPRKMWS